MTDAPIDVLLVDDHAMVASALAQGLVLTSEVTIVGIEHSLRGLLAFCEARADHPAPGVAVVDFTLPDGDGIDAALMLAEHYPATRVLILSASRSPQQLRDAVAVGCVGYIMKSAPLEVLQRTVREAARGQATFDAATLQEALSFDGGLNRDSAAGSEYHLSGREKEILGMLAAGVGTEVIATHLFLSQHTVRNHVRNLTAKLGVHSRLEAVSVAARHGLISVLPETPAIDRTTA